MEPSFLEKSDSKIYVMQDRTQLDNAVAYNAKQERKKAIIALEIAKKIDRPVIFLPRGFSLESQKLRAEKFRNKN